MTASAPTAGLAVALVLLGSWALGGQESAQAQDTVNFDIDPEITGNGANTLGTVEDCVQVDISSPSFDDVSDYEIDIVVSGDTQAPTMYDVLLNFDSTKVHIAALGTDRLIKMPGAYPYGDELPDSDGTYAADAYYLVGAGIEGDGTLVRVGLDIGASGVVTFSLDADPLTAYKSGAGNHPVMLDSGMLAINDYCGNPPVGGIAELPDVSDSAARDYIGLAGLAAAGALAAGGWYARRRLP
ncbi:MAG: hypothetical protein MUP14_10105 [Dehalococcoidia bacterium]|nr:hypothetical protein [Dehalococcoidia bacterium]